MKTIKMVKKIFLASLILGNLSFISFANGKTIKIAAVAPTTGPLTQFGDMMRQGVFTAAEVINSKGGVKGKKIEVIIEDDACEPKQGPVVANRIINQKIKFVVGPICSSVSIASAPVYNEEGVIMITPASTAPNLTDGKNFHFIFRTIGRDDQQGPAASKFIIETLKPKKVAVLHDKQSFGLGVANQVNQQLRTAKVDVVMFEGINAGDSDYSAVITKLKRNNVDFVYYGGYHPEMGLLLRQANEQGLEKVKFMGPESVASSEIATIAGKSANGMLLTQAPNFALEPKNAEIVKAFKDKKRDPEGAFQLTAFAAVQAIVQAIENVGEDSQKVADYLHSNNFETVLGNISWNKQGDLKDFEFKVFEWFIDGIKPVN